MSARALTSEYSKFIFQLSGSKVDGVCGFFAAFASALKEGGDFRRFINHPCIEIREKVEVTQKLFGAIPETVASLLREILLKRKVGLVPEISRRLNEIRDQQGGIISASVESAVSMTDQQKTSFETKVAAAIGKKVTATYSVEKSLLAGFRVRIGTTILDNSVKNQLGKITDVLHLL